MSTTNKRRTTPLLWGGAAVSAVALVLGVNGTLSSWTSAVIGNSHNSVASTTAVALVETGTDSAGNPVTCDTANTATNSVTCSNLNKYGGVSGGTAELGSSTDNITALAPGDSRTATVTLTNDGTGSGTLALTSGSCSNAVNDATGGDTTAGYNLCSKITVSVACTGDVTVAATTPVTLSAFSGASIGSLAPNQAATCTFTVALPSSTPSGYSNQLASQALTWTLAS